MSTYWSHDSVSNSADRNKRTTRVPSDCVPADDVDGVGQGQTVASASCQGPVRLHALRHRGHRQRRAVARLAGPERPYPTIAEQAPAQAHAGAPGRGVAALDEVRRAHFAQSRKLIHRFKGREIKTIGDSFMAAFKSVDSALDYARALKKDTGHPQVTIRAGIHIGPIHVEESDMFGGAVNFAARVIGAIHGAEIWLSDRAKEDIDRLGAARHKKLRWERHEGVAMKGFPGAFTLWSLQSPD